MAIYKKSDALKNGFDINIHFETDEQKVAQAWREAKELRGGKSIDELKQKCAIESSDAKHVNNQAQMMIA